MTLDNAVEALLKRDRQIVLVGLVVIVLLAWGYLIVLANDMNAMSSMAVLSDTPVPTDSRIDDMSGMSSMSDMSGMGGMAGMSDDSTNDVSDVVSDMSMLRAWTANDALFMFGMWSVMMVAMMIPSATPVILLYARVVRKRMNEPFVPTGAFFMGYIVIWVGFSALATALQWGLEQLALLSPMLVTTSALLSGGVLIAAGVYQALPLKNACLRHCRSPVDFLSTHWQAGSKGAFVMGLRHGLYCLGCCWGLMLLLFVGGVMNLLWLAAIALFIMIEKVTPFGQRVRQVSAVLLTAAGIGMFFLA